MPSSRKNRRSPLAELMGPTPDEDCDSVGSTITANTMGRRGGSDVLGASAHGGGRSKNRRMNYHVRFDLSLTKKYKGSPAIDDKQRCIRWYSYRDTDRMKEATLELARDMGKQDQKSNGKSGCHALLGKLIDACSKAKDETNKTLLKKKDFAKLSAFLNSPEYVGLETAMNFDLMADKLNRRYTLLRKVLGEQGNDNTIQDLLRGPACKEEMGRLSAKISLCSRLLARHLALAAISKS